MSDQEVVDLVKRTVEEAIKRDGSSEGVIRLTLLASNCAVRHLYLPYQTVQGLSRIAAWSIYTCGVLGHVKLCVSDGSRSGT